MLKPAKNQWRPNNVVSDTFHVGIELELYMPIEGEVDTEACEERQIESMRSDLESISNFDILRDYMGLSRDEARSLEDYFDSETWINDYMDGYTVECGGRRCEYCEGRSGDGREALADRLKDLVNNPSFKVVDDGSIEAEGNTIDAEVCWNFNARIEAFKDNFKILEALKKEGAEYNKSCGLHINLNNYLKVPKNYIPIEDLDFLFKFVAGHREDSTYCTDDGGMNTAKYSMIYNQGDKLEFRFFSPTLNAELLNNYIMLSHIVYKRLAGIDTKLPKPVAEYFKARIFKNLTFFNFFELLSNWQKYLALNFNHFFNNG
jgi:ferredoxin